MKKILSLMICAGIILTGLFGVAFTTSAASSLEMVLVGEFAGYYKIASASDFAKIAEDTTAGYVITNDITEEITESIPEFTGELIGVNADATAEEMRTVNVNISNAGTTATGLFNSITRGATFKNITLTGSINASGATSVGSFAGTTVASSSVGEISFSNCVNKAAVTGSSKVGGFVGACAEWNLMSTFDNCVNEGTVTGGWITAGMVGIVGANSVVITNSANIGSVVSNSNSVGGFVGYYYGETNGTKIVSNSYNSGDVTGDNVVGGVIGYLYESGYTCQIENVFNSGKITATNAGEWPSVGGIIGKQKKSSKNKYIAPKLTNCYNAGDINASDTAKTMDPIFAVAENIYGTTYTNVYYLEDTFTKTPFTTPNVGTLAKVSYDELANLNLGDAWEFNEEANYPFPVLKSITYKAPESHIYAVNFNVAEGGSVNAVSGNAYKYTKVEFEVIPENGSVASVMINGVPVEGVNNVYTTGIVLGNVDVEVSFTVTAPEMVNGADYVFTGVTDEGYNTSCIFAVIGSGNADYVLGEFGVILSLTSAEFDLSNADYIYPGINGANANGHYGIEIIDNGNVLGDTYYAIPYAKYTHNGEEYVNYGSSVTISFGNN